MWHIWMGQREEEEEAALTHTDTPESQTFTLPDTKTVRPCWVRWIFLLLQVLLMHNLLMHSQADSLVADQADESLTCT